jgi:long-chain fatty acid transport protein
MKRILSFVAVAAVVAASLPAWAGGFAAARFGGEHGNPTETNPWSLYYNPGGIGMSEGTNLGIDSSFVLRDAEYVRPATGDGSNPETPFNSGTGSVSNFIISPAFGVTHHFGDDLPLAVGFAFFAPFGGSAVWDQVDASERYPGAVDGPQRWYTIDGTIRTLSFTGGLAYNIEPANLSIGLAGNYYVHQLDTIRARNDNGTDDLETAGAGGEPVLKEGRSYVEADTANFGFGIGVLWEPMPDEMWVGLSYQSQPGFGATDMEGKLKNLLGQGGATEQDIVFRQELPDIIRLGVRYRPQEKLELRIFGDYTRWSVFDQQCLARKGGDLDTQCSTKGDGSAEDPRDSAIQVFGRSWEDTFGVRLGASYWLLDGDLELIGGAGYDSNAIPDETLEPALQDYDKFTASAGARYAFTDWVALSLTATNVFYLSRDTSDVDTAETLVGVSRQPSSSGEYTQNIFLVNTGLELSF